MTWWLIKSYFGCGSMEAGSWISTVFFTVVAYRVVPGASRRADTRSSPLELESEGDPRL